MSNRQRRHRGAFTVSGSCNQDDQNPYVVVAVRSGPTAKWTLRRLGPNRPADFWDDHPSLATGPAGRVYAVWSRLLRWTYEGVVVSSTADGGRTWSSPRPIDRRLSFPRLATATEAHRRGAVGRRQAEQVVGAAAGRVEGGGPGRVGETARADEQPSHVSPLRTYTKTCPFELTATPVTSPR